ncbi:phospholipase D-like domain-containing protein [Flavobacterium sp. LM4]|uniref:phospholipase D-like domain-containing protein n=1 Tax=Flavobacterium sp. LM4 TaxID=1938609 RepID=UPI000992E558|nr:phospholipase D-like domain-containing protein [Flavobacterium sp. LM4]
MKRQAVNRFQAESLRLTKTTKEGILKSIEKSSIQELKKIAPNLDDNIEMTSIVDKAELFLNQSEPLDLNDVNTEAIILKFGRPVFFIENNTPLLTGNDIEKFQQLINNATANLRLTEKIKSVGRVETENLPGYDWLGTAWLFDENLLITNRHVASEFVAKIGTGYKFKRFGNNIVDSRIDFLCEFNNQNSSEFSILECLYLASSQEHDIAIFKIKSDSLSGHIPINILGGNPQIREDIAVIGYPAYDSRTSSIQDMQRIYEGVYDVKRLAPGKITNVYQNEGIALHDATTLGGNSGSLVLSLETGKAVALHFAGKESKGNYCVASSTLKRVIDRIPRKIYPVNGFSSDVVSAFESFDEMVGRNCRLEQYTKIQVPSFKISGRFVTYASPDSTYYATQKFFEQAEESILIGIYDFSAEHMVACIKDAIDRGVTVSLMLDIDSSKELEVYKKLQKYGVECIPAPSCASENIHYFSSSHEKVIVIDNQWTLIQSGNYSDNSIPYNKGNGEIIEGSFKNGNRDMGVAIESKPLAKFFTQILRADMQLERSAAGEEKIQSLLSTSEFLIEAPAKRPSILFPSEEFNHTHRVQVQPILSPDNYMSEIPNFIRTAKKSIKIEQQYIRVGQVEISKLLQAINEAKENGDENFSVQIIVAPPNPRGGAKDAEKTQKEVDVLRGMGFEVLLLSNKHFVHCHNKLLIVDDEAVLISSQNWSDSAVVKNREAGIIIYDKEITKYYGKIFDADWTMSEESIEEIIPTKEVINIEAYSSNAGKYIIVDACDFQEV